MENGILNAVKSLASTVEGIRNDMQGMQQSIAEIKSRMVTKEIFEESIADLSESISFIAQNAVTKDQLLASEDRIKQEITKELTGKINDSENKLFEYLGEQFDYFKGENFVAPIRGLNDKNDLTAVKLEQKKVFTKDDREEITDIPYLLDLK